MAKTALAAPEPEKETLIIPKEKSTTIEVKIEGVMPLLSHSKNEARMILDMAYARQRYNKGAKPPKPKPLTAFEEFLGTLYLMPGQEHPTRVLQVGEEWTAKEAAGRYGFPGKAIVKGMVTAASKFMSGYNLDHVNSITVLGGPLLLVEYSAVRMICDLIPMPSRAKSEKGRAEESRSKRPVVRSMFPTWTMTFSLKFQQNLFTNQDVLILLANMGDKIGVGSERKEKPGCDKGTFRIVEASAVMEK